jgi:hypothetical protein
VFSVKCSVNKDSSSANNDVPTDYDVVGLLRMTSVGEFVILRERHAVVDGGEENIEAYFD